MEKLGIDIKLLIAQLINFGIFFFVIKKFIAKPFMSFLKQEQKNEADKQKAQREIQQKEEELASYEKKSREEMKRAFDKAITKVKEDANVLRVQLIEQARGDASDLVERAKKQIDEERGKMEQDLKDKLAEASTLVVYKALSEYLTEDDQRKITQHILTRLSKGNVLYEN